MSRVGRVLVLAGVLLAATSLASAQEGRRGPMMGQRGNFLGLLSQEKVQQELKLSDEQAEKVKEIAGKVRSDMSQDWSGLRDITDRAQRRAKMTELSNQADQKAREQLRDVLTQEQWRRLFQIRLQVRGVAASLASGRLADRMNLTDEQKQKVAEIEKAAQAKADEAQSGLRDLSQEQRREKMREIREKMQKIRAEADEKTLEALTAEQKETIEKMKGEKFEL